MSTKTTNYNLTKPEITDDIDVSIPELAEDMDIIDGELKNQKDRVDNIIAQSGTSDTEVVDARSSAVKGTTFTVLDDRLEAVEGDTNTLAGAGGLVEKANKSDLDTQVTNFNTHSADYEYQTPTIVGTQIQITKQSNTTRLYFKLDANLSGGAITISLDGGSTDKPLQDIEGVAVSSLDKGFVEVVADATFFTLRPKGASKDLINSYLKRIANAEAVLDIYDRTDPSANDVFYDILDGTNDYSKGLLDITKTKATITLTAGTTVLTDKVESTSGFQIGQEITIQDDLNKEEGIVSLVDVTESVTFDVTTPTQVVVSAYDTSGNGGRKLVRLDNGWLVALMINSTTSLEVYYSIDNGLSWNQLAYFTSGFNGGASLAVDGNIIKILASTTSTLYSLSFDATSITSPYNMSGIQVTVDSGQINGMVLNPSLTIDSNGNLYGAWQTKNATYPNKFNPRYSKSTDGGVTWDTPTQVGTDNTTGYDLENPSIIIMDNGYPAFFVSRATANQIQCFKFNGSTWDIVIVYNGTTYFQQNPSADVLSDGTIIVAWEGSDATATSVDNIRFSKSIDNGITWTKADGTAGHDKLTTGTARNHEYASITRDTNDNIFIVFHGYTSDSASFQNIRYIKYNGTIWEAIVNVTADVSNAHTFVSVLNNFRDFEFPMFIYKDAIVLTANAVSFYGKWTEQVTTPHLEVSALANSYKKNAVIYRSNVTIDTVTQTMAIADFVDETVYDVTTPTQVVASAYDTSGNGGRKLVRLDNGWLVVATKTTDSFYFYKSENHGVTWGQLCYIYVTNIDDNDIAIASKGNFLYVIHGNGTSAIRSYAFDVTAAANVNIVGNSSYGYQSFDSLTAIGNLSLAINSTGTELHATWSSKNSTYPNSFNIRYAKGTIAGDGSVTWDVVTQLTTQNTTGQNAQNPSIVINALGYPVAIYDYNNDTTAHNIRAQYHNGTIWSGGLGIIVFGASTTQSNPSADVLSDGTIVVAWNGKDATDTAVDNIRFSQSIDNGVTWSAMEKLTSGNTLAQAEPSITRNSDDEVFIMYWGRSTIVSTNNIQLIQGNTLGWGAIQNITTADNGNTIPNFRPSAIANFRSFDKPLLIFMQNTVDIKFYGKWTEGTTVPLLNSDVRYNITPTPTTNEIGTWVTVEKDAGFTVDGKISLVDTIANESYTDMVKTVTNIDVNTDEILLIGNGGLEEKATVKLTLTRTGTEIVKKVKKVLGYIG